MAKQTKPAPDGERCEALIMDSYLRPTDSQCMHYATIDINGRQLCVKHAGPYSLTLALEAGTAKRIPLTKIILSGHRFVDKGKFLEDA